MFRPGFTVTESGFKFNLKFRGLVSESLHIYIRLKGIFRCFARPSFMVNHKPGYNSRKIPRSSLTVIQTRRYIIALHIYI